MAAGTIAFLLGIIAVQQLTALPSAVVLWSSLGVIAAALLALRHRLPPRLLLSTALLAAGFCWAALRAQTVLDAQLSPELEGLDLVVVGVVAEPPTRDGRRVRFLFDGESLTTGSAPESFPLRLRLNWYGEAPALVPGDRWRLTVRLKRRHGMLNPGGFDYEGWLFREGIGATGYVREAATARRVGQSGAYPLQRLRHRLKQRLLELTEGRPGAGMLIALALGERDGISDGQWELLRRTGTSHLMAISGLHVGLVASLAYWLVRLAWALSGVAARIPAPRAAAFAAVLAALGYAALAGFSVPTRRAFIMVSVAMGGLLLQRTVRPVRLLAVAALLVLLLDPLAVNGAGFWLSFGAVAAILYGFFGRRQRRRLRWGRVQWVVALGLLPLSLFFFGSAAVSGPLANLVAVPWVGMTVVPLTLAGAATALPLPGLAGTLLHLADASLALLWRLLAWLGEIIPTLDLPPPGIPALLLAGVGVAWLLAPRGWPARALGAVWLLPLFSAGAPALPAGSARVAVLDVGQGLAVAVETRRHALLFDTGPRFPSGFAAASAAVVPYFEGRGVRRLDRVVISHADNDHAGGLETVQERFEIGELLTGAPARFEGARWCHAGMRWRWDGVHFEFLHPVERRPDGPENSGSCVLKVSAGGRSVLVPGDIEAATERELVARLGAGLAADVVIAPHHGSTTSSTAALVEAVSPRWVIYSTGFLNRWDFPRPSVVERYRRAGAEGVETAHAGAVVLELKREGITPSPMRRDARRYWHHR